MNINPGLLSILSGRAAFMVFSLLLIWLLIALLSPDFFALEWRDGRVYGGLIDILNRSVPIALLGLGMSLVIATGGIDLSVGAVMAIAGAVSANLIAAGNENMILIVTAGLGAGLVAGLINGSLVTLAGVQPIVATLVLMVAGRGFAQLINAGQIITFQFPAFAYIGTGAFLGLPFAVIILIVLLVSLLLLMRRSALGLLVEASGANPLAAYYMGINVNFIKLMAYGFCGFCAALAGLIVTADIQGADANNAGLWFELDAILAVVIGGAALQGGRFYLVLTVLAVVIIQSLSTLIVISGLPAKTNLLFKALVILLILLAQSKPFLAHFHFAGKKA